MVLLIHDARSGIVPVQPVEHRAQLRPLKNEFGISCSVKTIERLVQLDLEFKRAFCSTVSVPNQVGL